MWHSLNRKHSFITLPLFAFVCIISNQGVWAGPDYGGSLQMANEVDSFGFDVLKVKFVLKHAWDPFLSMVLA